MINVKYVKRKMILLSLFFVMNNFGMDFSEFGQRDLIPYQTTIDDSNNQKVLIKLGDDKSFSADCWKVAAIPFLKEKLNENEIDLTDLSN